MREDGVTDGTFRGLPVRVLHTDETRGASAKDVPVAGGSGEGVSPTSRNEEGTPFSTLTDRSRPMTGTRREGQRRTPKDYFVGPRSSPRSPVTTSLLVLGLPYRRNPDDTPVPVNTPVRRTDVLGSVYTGGKWSCNSPRPPVPIEKPPQTEAEPEAMCPV